MPFKMHKIKKNFQKKNLLFPILFLNVFIFADTADSDDMSHLVTFIFIFTVCQICFKSLQRVNLLLHAYRQQILQSLLSTSGYDASVPPDFEMGKSPL